MLGIFVEVILPVFLVAGLGYALERTLRPPIAPFNQLVLNVLLPALIFTSLLGVDFQSEEPIRITAYAFLLAIVMMAIAFLIIRIARLDRVTGSAFMLTAALPNLVNYALPVGLLAFGEEGLAFGTLLASIQSVYALTLATIIASSGHTPLRQSLVAAARQPILYAVAAALVLNLTDVAVPTFVMSALTMTGQAAIPVMLVVLGMNLSTTTAVQQPGLVSLAVFTRLVVGTLVGWGLVVVLGIGGVARDVMILGAAMPTAVFTILTATQFNSRPRFVSDVVVVSTIVSVLTLTVVLAILSGRVAL